MQLLKRRKIWSDNISLSSPTHSVIPIPTCKAPLDLSQPADSLPSRRRSEERVLLGSPARIEAFPASPLLPRTTGPSSVSLPLDLGMLAAGQQTALGTSWCRLRLYRPRASWRDPQHRSWPVIRLPTRLDSAHSILFVYFTVAIVCGYWL
jgi:hypothetical protein